MSAVIKTLRCPACGHEGVVRDWLGGEAIEGASFLVWCPGGPLFASEEAETRGDAPIGQLAVEFECLVCGEVFEEAST